MTYMYRPGEAMVLVLFLPSQSYSEAWMKAYMGENFNSYKT